MTAEVLVAWVVGAIVGVIEVPVIQWLKSVFKIEDKIAFLFVMIFSVLLSFLALLVTGGFSPFDLNHLFVYAASIITLSQITYGFFWKK
jgi:hypothetical protein